MDAATHEIEIRRKQLKAWITARYASTRAFCTAYGLNESEVSQLLRSKSFGSRRARNIEASAGMPYRYLEGANEGVPVGPQINAITKPATFAWPFHSSSYDDFMALSPQKRAELDIRISEFIAGATTKKRSA